LQLTFGGLAVPIMIAAGTDRILTLSAHPEAGEAQSNARRHDAALR